MRGRCAPARVRASKPRNTTRRPEKAEDHDHHEDPLRDGELAARISNTVIRAVSRTATKAKTTLGANRLFVVPQDTLTRGEQTLADAGASAAVLDLCHRWQMVMKKDVSREIEELMGRKPDEPPPQGPRPRHPTAGAVGARTHCGERRRRRARRRRRT